MFEHIRNTCGEDVELLHDVHERIQPIEAINLLKELEQYRPFFIEDPWLRNRMAISLSSAIRPASPSPWGENSSTIHTNG